MQPAPPTEPELSAYLDGELDADRTREIATALATDLALQAQYAALANADAAWKAAAQTAQFTPAVQLTDRAVDISAFALIIVVAVLVSLLLMAKLNEVIVWSLLIHSIVMTIALTWTVRIARDQNQL